MEKFNSILKLFAVIVAVLGFVKLSFKNAKQEMIINTQTQLIEELRTKPHNLRDSLYQEFTINELENKINLFNN